MVKYSCCLQVQREFKYRSHIDLSEDAEKNWSKEKSMRNDLHRAPVASSFLPHSRTFLRLQFQHFIDDEAEPVSEPDAEDKARKQTCSKLVRDKVLDMHTPKWLHENNAHMISLAC